MTKCLICQNRNTVASPAEVADFITLRVFKGKQVPVSLINCPQCHFSFFSYRFSDAEAEKLYSGYRETEYQEQRESVEPWYTKEINDIIGKDPLELASRDKNITDILRKNTDVSTIHSVLDYGGDKGQFIPKALSHASKYVFDISGVEPIAGVTALATLAACGQHSYDLVICSNVLEHVSDPIEIIHNIKGLLTKGQYLYIELPYDAMMSRGFIRNLQLLFNPHFSWVGLAKSYLRQRKHKGLPLMHEHINLFTPDTVKIMLQQAGFTVLASEVNTLTYGWIKPKIISVLARLD